MATVNEDLVAWLFAGPALRLDQLERAEVACRERDTSDRRRHIRC